MLFILTATVDPFVRIHPLFSKPAIRRLEYIKNVTSVHNHISLLDPSPNINFVENSGDLLKNRSMYPNLEKINYIDSRTSSFHSRGKGYSEILMINEMLATYPNEEFFVKLTGRYNISNWDTILNRVSSLINSNCFCATEEVNYLSRQFSTRLFLCRSDYWKSQLIQSLLDRVNDSIGYFIEHALFDSLNFKAPQLIYTKCAQNSTSASTSKSLNYDPIRSNLKKISNYVLKQ